MAMACVIISGQASERTVTIVTKPHAAGHCPFHALWQKVVPVRRTDRTVLEEFARALAPNNCRAGVAATVQARTPLPGCAQRSRGTLAARRGERRRPPSRSRCA